MKRLKAKKNVRVEVIAVRFSKKTIIDTDAIVKIEYEKQGFLRASSSALVHDMQGARIAIFDDSLEFTVHIFTDARGKIKPKNCELLIRKFRAIEVGGDQFIGAALIPLHEIRLHSPTRLNIPVRSINGFVTSAMLEVVVTLNGNANGKAESTTVLDDESVSSDVTDRTSIEGGRSGSPQETMHGYSSVSETPGLLDQNPEKISQSTLSQSRDQASPREQGIPPHKQVRFQRQEMDVLSPPLSLSLSQATRIGKLADRRSSVLKETTPSVYVGDSIASPVSSSATPSSKNDIVHEDHVNQRLRNNLTREIERLKMLYEDSTLQIVALIQERDTLTEAPSLANGRRELFLESRNNAGLLVAMREGDDLTDNLQNDLSQQRKDCHFAQISYADTRKQLEQALQQVEQLNHNIVELQESARALESSCMAAEDANEIAKRRIAELKHFETLYIQSTVSTSNRIANKSDELCPNPQDREDGTYSDPISAEHLEINEATEVAKWRIRFEDLKRDLAELKTSLQVKEQSREPAEMATEKVLGSQIALENCADLKSQLTIANKRIEKLSAQVKSLSNQNSKLSADLVDEVARHSENIRGYSVKINQLERSVSRVDGVATTTAAAGLSADSPASMKNVLPSPSPREPRNSGRHKRQQYTSEHDGIDGCADDEYDTDNIDSPAESTPTLQQDLSLLHSSSTSPAGSVMSPQDNGAGTVASDNISDEHDSLREVCDNISDEHDSLREELILAKMELAHQLTSNDQLQMEYRKVEKLVCQYKLEIATLQARLEDQSLT